MRADPTFAEAWYNLSDLLEEQVAQKPQSIVRALRLRPRPTMPTTIFILAWLIRRREEPKQPGPQRLGVDEGEYHFDSLVMVLAA
jgi:hypothetical protein